MKRILLVVVVALLVAASAQAAEERAAEALRAGATSIEVGINAFGFEKGGEIALRRHLAPRWAARLGFELYSVHTESTDGTSLGVGPGASQRGTLSTSDSRAYAVTAQAVSYPVRRGNCALALAAGPSITRRNSDRVEDAYYTSGSVEHERREEEENSHGIAARLDAGFEWFVDPRVALRARSGTALEWSTSATASLMPTTRAACSSSSTTSPATTARSG